MDLNTIVIIILVVCILLAIWLNYILNSAKRRFEDFYNQSVNQFLVEISDIKLPGRFLVNFKNPEFKDQNDPELATVKPYSKERIEVMWDNGYSCIINPKSLNIYDIR